MKVYAIHIEELSLPDVEKWPRSIVSVKTNEKIERLKFTDDKKRTLAGELLARYAIVLEKQVPNAELVFDVYESGKPYCRSFPNVHYNISHSGSWVVCAVSDGPIGVDIEKIGVADVQIAKRFFTEYEYQYLLRQENKAETFYKLWTLKESYIKCTGEGLTVPLNSFEFEFNGENIKLTSPRGNEFHFISEKIFEDYYLSVCSGEQYKVMSVERVTMEEIKKHV